VLELFNQCLSCSTAATRWATRRGSRWCAWNALVEHHDHHGRPRTPEGAFVRKLEDPTGIKRRARELITAS
jgi:hypothetical protein